MKFKIERPAREAQNTDCARRDSSGLSFGRGFDSPASTRLIASDHSIKDPQGSFYNAPIVKTR
jgi:hypothetical protein